MNDDIPRQRVNRHSRRNHIHQKLSDYMATPIESKIQRLLRLVTLVKTSRRITQPDVLAELGIQKSQYYRDKNRLEAMGLCFTYNRAQKCFELQKDRFLPVEQLSLAAFIFKWTWPRPGRFSGGP